MRPVCAAVTRLVSAQVSAACAAVRRFRRQLRRVAKPRAPVGGDQAHHRNGSLGPNSESLPTAAYLDSRDRASVTADLDAGLMFDLVLQQQIAVAAPATISTAGGGPALLTQRHYSATILRYRSETRSFPACYLSTVITCLRGIIALYESIIQSLYCIMALHSNTDCIAD